MSLETILAAIEASGEAEVAQLRAETQAHIRQILAGAEETASLRREEARREAVRPVAGERARRLHHAKLEALGTVGEVRDRLVAVTLEETRARLVGLRAAPDYAHILRRLIEEAIAALGEETGDGHRCRLEADPRDVAWVGGIVSDLGFSPTITPSADSWGGVVVRSGDGRIVVTNTLEARLERAAPFLRRSLAAFFEKELTETSEAVVPARSIP